ncbi:hypothetical protein [Gordonia sp. VNK21]|uniref:hypothetical protein n=1 Tax=Gordonia sp. VNK21 TaxID=3382483 RepID=UPI0038D4E4A3
MTFYAWTQDVPVDAEAYADIIGRMGRTPMPGLIVHLAIRDEGGAVSYLDVWESEQACDAAFASVVHPAVGPVLAERGIRPAGEPVRTAIDVLDVRFGDGSSRQP